VKARGNDESEEYNPEQPSRQFCTECRDYDEAADASNRNGTDHEGERAKQLPFRSCEFRLHAYRPSRMTSRNISRPNSALSCIRLRQYIHLLRSVSGSWHDFGRPCKRLLARGLGGWVRNRSKVMAARFAAYQVGDGLRRAQRFNRSP